MNNAWTIEFTRILSVVVIALLFGLVSDAWLLAVLIPAVIYIGWTLIQIRAFERWIRLGAKNKLAPDTSGIWQLIVQHIHRTQLKNKQHKKRLSEMASKFSATIAAIPDATIVLNSNLEIEWTNDASRELLGVDRKRDLGQRLDNLIRDPLLTELLQSDGTEEIEIGSPLDRFKTLVIRSVDFGNHQKLVSARDISQQIAVQKLRKAFIANASHELRTPLTVIAGYLEILQDDRELSANNIKQITNASQQATRMQNILDDMLVLSRLEAKTTSADTGKVVDMPNLLECLINDFKKTNAQDRHQFEVSIDSTLQLLAIENEVHSLCQNLLSNAVKYSIDGGLIKVCWQISKQGLACLRVEDNGEGIAAENLSRLTERFFRVNVSRSRQIGGTGLGLSIVKHILENHGGHLEIESELGKGSIFSAYFPVYRIHATS